MASSSGRSSPEERGDAPGGRRPAGAPADGYVAWFFGGLGRLRVTLWCAWALLPALVVAVARFLLLPGESWGFSFLFIALGLPVWGVVGLALLAAGLVVRRSAWPTLVAAVLALAGAFAGFGATRWIPPEWTVPATARWRFERTALTESPMEVPGDAYFSGCGYFVREDAARGDATHASLSLRGYELRVPRGRASRQVGRQVGADLALVAPLRDGWWYVYLDF